MENALAGHAEKPEFKVRQLYVPVVALAGALLAVYSALNWALVAHTNLLPLNDTVVDLWLPLGASWILVLVLVQRRLGLLKPDARRKLPVFDHFLAVIIIAVPTILAQGYVRAASGDITHVNDASDIASAPETRYYAADHICVAYSDAVLKPVVGTSGRYGASVFVRLYAAEPLCRAASVGTAHRKVWIGLKSQTLFSNSLTDAEKNVRYTDFIYQATVQFQHEDPHSYRFFERVGRNEDGKNFLAALKNAPGSLDVTGVIILIPHKEPFGERTTSFPKLTVQAQLRWAFGALALGAVGWLAYVLARPLDAKKLRQWREGKSRDAGKERQILSLFLIPTRTHYGLPVLIDLNLLVFAAMVWSGLGFIAFETNDLLAWGANYRPALHGFGVLRLVFSQFIHGGFLHLANNLYGLVFAGLFLLPVLRNAGLIACYLIAGLGGSIASAAVHPATVAVGASGAIFGLFGILLTLALRRNDRLTVVRSVILINVAIFVALNLFVGAVSRGIDNAAHIGGLATGVLLGLLLHANQGVRASKRSPVVKLDDGTSQP